MSLPEVSRQFAAPSDNFLGLPKEASSWEGSRYRILPVPHEATVSYGGGTREGPAAIIRASQQVEFYDAELDDEVWEVGICTLPAFDGGAEDPAAMDAALEAEARSLKSEEHVLIALGGEHSITPPLALPWMEDPDVWVLCIDAHADLRSSYQGTPYSHACAMHRLAETGRTVQVGIRSLSRPEMDLARDKDLLMIHGWELDPAGAWLDRVFERLGEKVYVSLDVDGLDPSIMPATGTPEPGGLDWAQLTALFDRLGRERTVVAADVVELAPIPGLHAPDFLAARAVYRLIGAIEAGR